MTPQQNKSQSEKPGITVKIGLAPAFETTMSKEKMLELCLHMEEACIGLFMEPDYIKKHGEAAWELHCHQN